MTVAHFFLRNKRENEIFFYEQLTALLFFSNYINKQKIKKRNKKAKPKPKIFCSSKKQTNQ